MDRWVQVISPCSPCNMLLHSTKTRRMCPEFHPRCCHPSSFWSILPWYSCMCSKGTDLYLKWSSKLPWYDQMFRHFKHHFKHHFAWFQGIFLPMSSSLVHLSPSSRISSHVELGSLEVQLTAIMSSLSSSEKSRGDPDFLTICILYINVY